VALSIPVVLALVLSSCSREPAIRLRPTTINLQQRTELAINAMTQSVDPKLNYQPYFMVIYGDPPKMCTTSGIMVTGQDVLLMPWSLRG